MRLAAAALLCVVCGAAPAQPGQPLHLAATYPLTPRDLPYAGPAPATHELALGLYSFRDTPWEPQRVLQAVREAAPLLAQCGVRLAGAELRQLDGGEAELRDLYTPVARALVQRLQPAKPAVFFLRDTRNRPAFDAEAFGRGNTRTRPELAGTVWLTAPVRDLPIALAHELAHVLMDSGEHSEAPGNLMREDTEPGNTRLSAEQCRRMQKNGATNGWLQPTRPELR